MPLLPMDLLRTPAFSAGLIVQLLFAVGMQGFFLIFTLWLQTGEHYSPIRAGLTTVAFSVGSFLSVGAAIPLAIRFGRIVLAAGALGMAAGLAIIGYAAQSTDGDIAWWKLAPGLLIGGAGLGLLVVPLVNVVLAGVPSRLAGGASGLFNTFNQFGGAVGVAVVGTIFFGRISDHGMTAAFTHAIGFAVALLVLAAAVSLMLPGTAVMDADEG